MKNLVIPFLSLLLFTQILPAQTSKTFKFRTTVNDAAGQALANKQVTLGIDLMQESTTIYAENHLLETNSSGLVKLEIGQGNVVVSGVFSNINWSLPTFIRVFIDRTGGTDLQELGTANLEPLIQQGTVVNLSNNAGTIYANDAERSPGRSLEQLTNPQKGEIAYFDGTAWQRISKDDIAYYDGSAWQRLSIGDSGQAILIGETRVTNFNVTLPNNDILSVHPTDNSVSVQWSSLGTNISTLQDFKTADAAIQDFNGWNNTQEIVAQLGKNNDANYAANQCADLVANGFDDWYLPSAGELNEIFKQLGPSASGGRNLITTGFYWSSSELTDDGAWGQGFVVGNRGNSSKISDSRSRCVRKLSK